MKQLRKYCFLLIIGIFSGYSCESDLVGDQVQIRIKNISQFEYFDVKVNTSGGENFYGTIKSNEYSDYNKFEFAYSYAFVELKIDEDTFTLQPIDYVGEEMLNSGKYTYEIDATSVGGQHERLSLKLVED